MQPRVLVPALAALAASVSAADVHVSTTTDLQNAIAAATPGTRILVDPGSYGGNLYFTNVHGTSSAHIVVAASDPAHKPVIAGGSEGIHISDAAWVELRDLAFSGQGFQAINLDDGGSYDTPAHDVILHGLTIENAGTDIAGAGITNGIKLSGLDSFTVEGCSIHNWGNGDGIDMVGCHHGVIDGCTFRSDGATSHSLQTKGGSRDIAIRHCLLDHCGDRGLQMGGSTGLTFFRPSSSVGYEAQDITAEYDVFVGCEASVAFVGVDHPVFRFNTCYCPTTWLMRILQENTTAGFVPCRDGEVTDNIFVWGTGLQTTINIGSNTAPETFTFARNWWFDRDNPGASAPSLPSTESGGHIGVDPQFVDAAGGDFHLQPGSPANIAGAYATGGGTTTSGTTTSGATTSGGSTGTGGSPVGGGGHSGGCGLGSLAGLIALGFLGFRRRR